MHILEWSVVQSIINSKFFYTVYWWTRVLYTNLMFHLYSVCFSILVSTLYFRFISQHWDLSGNARTQYIQGEDLKAGLIVQTFQKIPRVILKLKLKIISGRYRRIRINSYFVINRFRKRGSTSMKNFKTWYGSLKHFLLNQSL